MKMSLVLTLFCLIAVPLVIGQDTEWNSPNVTACFSAQSVAINFIYTPSSGSSSFLLVSWHRKVASQGSAEKSIAELSSDGTFTVLPNTALVGRLNKTGSFGLVISDPTTGDSGEYSIKLRTSSGNDNIGKGMLTITDPCIREEVENKCKKVTCQSSQTSPTYTWTGPKNNTAGTITVCEGESGTYTCCVKSSNTNCVTAVISAPNGSGTTDTNTDSGDPGSDSGAIIGAVVGGVVVLIIAIVVAVILYRKKKAEKSDYHPTATGDRV